MKWMGQALPVALALWLMAPPVGAQAADHVIYVTIDGVRAEDLFAGPDSAIMVNAKQSGIRDTTAFVQRWWRNTAAERRRVMMPFLWDTLVPMGTVLGNPQASNPVVVTNGLRFSGPGYMEMFTGHARTDVTSNADRRYRYTTVFEVVNAQPGNRATAVAAFVSWTTQARLAATKTGEFVSNGPFEDLPAELDSPMMRQLHRLESRTRHEDESVRYDAFTHDLAMEWLRRYKPVLLHVGFGETDVDAHSRRYDRYIEMLHTTDRMLSELWHAAEASPGMAGRTTIIVTTDHGRGAIGADWTDHGRDVLNADRWWFLVAGAGVPARGEIDASMTQSQVAPTILALLGIDYHLLDAPVAAPAFDLIRR